MLIGQSYYHWYNTKDICSWSVRENSFYEFVPEFQIRVWNLVLAWSRWIPKNIVHRESKKESPNFIISNKAEKQSGAGERQKITKSSSHIYEKDRIVPILVDKSSQVEPHVSFLYNENRTSPNHVWLLLVELGHFCCK